MVGGCLILLILLIWVIFVVFAALPAWALVVIGLVVVLFAATSDE